MKEKLPYCVQEITAKKRASGTAFLFTRYRGETERRTTHVKAWRLCALIIALVCISPTSPRAYIPPYVPHEPPAKREKPVTLIEVYPTGYYGPLKGQQKYAHGSYRKEVRVNGSGKFTSSGVPPSIGTIAADTKHYPYGTKFRIRETNLVVTVQDTGPAIKGKKRIDVFCGWGDQGRKTALTWDKNSPVTLEVLHIPKKTKRG